MLPLFESQKSTLDSDLQFTDVTDSFVVVIFVLDLQIPDAHQFC